MKTIDAIESDEECDVALAELGAIKAQFLRADADLDQALAKVRQEFEPRYKIKLDSGELVPGKDVEDKLFGLIQDYAEQNRRRLLELSGKKSVDFMHGVVGWKKDPDSIAELPLTDEDKAESMLAKILKKVVALVATITTKLGKLPISNFIAVSVKWDRSTLLDAVNKGNVNEAQLKKHGLEVKRGIDQFYCKPKSEKRPT